MLVENTEIKVKIYKASKDFNIWVEINKNDNSVYAYMIKNGYGLVVPMFGRPLDETYTFEKFMSMVADNIDNYISYYEMKCKEDEEDED